MNPAVLAEAPRIRTERYWLHVLLFVLTLLTTTAVGARLAYNFEHNRPLLFEEDFFGTIEILGNPASLANGLPFSLTLLSILLAHEMGHYLACLHYGINASLPYFLPAPTLIGTLGAFIRIRSPICFRRQLFDIGIAGPIAGFVFVIPALAIGLAYSKVIPGIVPQGDLIFSTPWILRGLEVLILPGASPEDIYLHPVARAAWVGVFATALNLLPIGQLDGGHILYSFIGEWHRPLSKLFIVLLIPMGFFYSWSWLIWAGLLVLFGMRHPKIYDNAPMGRGRMKLGFLALIMLLLCFTVVPVGTVEATASAFSNAAAFEELTRD